MAGNPAQRDRSAQRKRANHQRRQKRASVTQHTGDRRCGHSAGIVGFGGSDSTFFIEGKPMPQPDQMPAAWYSSVMPNFHQALGIPLLRGRNFNDHDTADAQAVVIINQTMARRYWGDENPVGKRIGNGDPDHPKWKEIVGIAGNVKYFSLEAEQPPMMYLPLAQAPDPGMTFALRTAGPPLEMASAVRNAVWSLDKN